MIFNTKNRMMIKNNKKRYYNILLAIGLIIVTIVGCEKMDDTYYHFENNLGNFNGNAIEYLQSRGGGYDSMLYAISRVTGLEDSIIAGGGTVFAMPNASFTLALENLNKVRQRAIPPRAPLSIATLDSAELDTLMYRYVIGGLFNTDSIAQFADGLTVESLKYDYLMQLQYFHNSSSGYQEGGPEYLEYSDRNESIFERYWVEATTNTVDIKTNNSYVHILSPGHGFGFGQIVTRMNK